MDGMTIYLGVLPAELVRGHPTQLGDPKAMHGGTLSYQASHHIVVALFDARTAARITDARIRHCGSFSSGFSVMVAPSHARAILRAWSRHSSKRCGSMATLMWVFRDDARRLATSMKCSRSANST